MKELSVTFPPRNKFPGAHSQLSQLVYSVVLDRWSLQPLLLREKLSTKFPLVGLKPPTLRVNTTQPPVNTHPTTHTHTHTHTHTRTHTHTHTHMMQPHPLLSLQEASRVANLESYLHQADVILRRCVSTSFKTFSGINRIIVKLTLHSSCRLIQNYCTI